MDKKIKEKFIYAIKQKREEIVKIENYLSNKKLNKDILNKMEILLRTKQNDLNILLSLTNEEKSLSEEEICIIISEYANKKYVNELSEYISANYFYGFEIYKMLKNGFQLDLAIKMFDFKVKLKTITSRLSEVAALANLLYFNDSITALLFENAYQNNNAVKNDVISSIRNGLIFDDKHKTKVIKGITLVSKTDEGLQKLEFLINYIYLNDDSEYLKLISLESARNGLIVADFPIHKSNNSYYSAFYKFIYLSEKESLEKREYTFHHEISHFLDNIKGEEINKKSYEYFSVNDENIKLILEKIKANIMILPRGLSLSYFSNLKIEQYINNPTMLKKWYDEIKKTHPYSCSEDIKLFLQQKRLYERKKYKSLIGYISDIYDGLSNGLIYQMGCSGHGRKYYSDSSNLFKEFIANVVLIYNSDGADVLYHEFGPELTTLIIDMYDNFIKNDGYIQNII